MNIHEAKSQLSKIIEEVCTTGKSVTIHKAGKPIVSVVPYVQRTKRRTLGVLSGGLPIPDDFDSMDARAIEDLFGGSA